MSFESFRTHCLRLGIPSSRAFAIHGPLTSLVVAMDNMDPHVLNNFMAIPFADWISLIAKVEELRDPLAGFKFDKTMYSIGQKEREADV